MEEKVETDPNDPFQNENPLDQENPEITGGEGKPGEAIVSPDVEAKPKKPPKAKPPKKA